MSAAMATVHLKLIVGKQQATSRRCRQQIREPAGTGTIARDLVTAHLVIEYNP
jgi:hypothetical protein